MSSPPNNRLESELPRPTRKSEALLLAAQPPRWVPMKLGILGGVFAIVLVAAPAVHAIERANHPKLAQYCAGARKQSDAPVVDPTQLPPSADFSQPRPTEVLGQKVQTASRRLGFEGTLLLGLIVSDRGKARDTQVLESSGHVQLDREAMEIVQGSVFLPARLSKKAVASCMVLQITFKIASSTPPSSTTVDHIVCSVPA